MKIGDQVLETLRIDCHQIHNGSLGARLSGTNTKTERLIVDSHNCGGAQVHSNAKASLKILMKNSGLGEIGQAKSKADGVTHPGGLFGVSNELDEEAQPHGTKKHKQIMGEFEKSTMIKGEGVGSSQSTNQRSISQTRFCHFFFPMLNKVFVQHTRPILLGQLPQILGGEGSFGTKFQNGGHPRKGKLGEEASSLLSAQIVLFDCRRGRVAQKDTNHHLSSKQNEVGEEPTKIIEPPIKRHQTSVVVELATIGEEVEDQKDGQSPPEGAKGLLLFHHIQKVGDEPPRNWSCNGRNRFRDGGAVDGSPQGNVLENREETQQDHQTNLKLFEAVPGFLAKEFVEFIMVHSTLFGAFDFMVARLAGGITSDEEQGGNSSEKQIHNGNKNQKGFHETLPKIIVLPNRVKERALRTKGRSLLHGERQLLLRGGVGGKPERKGHNKKEEKKKKQTKKTKNRENEKKRRKNRHESPRGGKKQQCCSENCVYMENTP